ncbi:MAG: hypothetical protein KC800_19410 [Candidatus Eremiobacteraeota bacterium]|nr:hypothetical protein [Candidatus Eremiobacteraeota bacterium]
MKKMSVPTLNPAGYNQVLECRHSLLRQAMLSHQPRPRPMGLNTDTVARTSLSPRPAGPGRRRKRAADSQEQTLSPEEVRTILRRGYQTLMFLAVFTMVTLGVDLLLTVS